MKSLDDMVNISKQKLLDYIEHEEIAFQFCDGLLNIVHPNGNYGEEDLKQNTLCEFEEVKRSITECNSIKVVGKEDIISETDELGLNEFAEWAIETDLLILVDDYLLLCLPDPDTRNVIFETA